jgi:hypothetical protein
LFQNILSDLEKDYIDKIDPVKLFKTGIQAMLQSLDPYTEFEDLRVAQSMKESVSGKYGGVGLVIGNRNGRVLPVDAASKEPSDMPQGVSGGSAGGSAAGGGGGVVVLDAFEGYAYDWDLRPGDVLLSIDDVDCTAGGVENVRDLLRGNPDTEVSHFENALHTELHFWFTFILIFEIPTCYYSLYLLASATYASFCAGASVLPPGGLPRPAEGKRGGARGGAAAAAGAAVRRAPGHAAGQSTYVLDYLSTTA